MIPYQNFEVVQEGTKHQSRVLNDLGRHTEQSYRKDDMVVNKDSTVSLGILLCLTRITISSKTPTITARNNHRTERSLVFFETTIPSNRSLVTHLTSF